MHIFFKNCTRNQIFCCRFFVANFARFEGSLIVQDKKNCKMNFTSADNFVETFYKNCVDVISLVFTVDLFKATWLLIIILISISFNHIQIQNSYEKWKLRTGSQSSLVKLLKQKQLHFPSRRNDLASWLVKKLRRNPRYRGGTSNFRLLNLRLKTLDQTSLNYSLEVSFPTKPA